MCCNSQQYIAGPVGGSGVAILWGEWGACGGEHKVGPQTPHTMVERWDHALEGSDTDARCCQGRPENLLPHLGFINISNIATTIACKMIILLIVAHLYFLNADDIILGRTIADITNFKLGHLSLFLL